MDVYVDGQALQAEPGVAETLGGIVEQVRASLDTNSRVIVGIACDDQEITGGDLEARLSQPAESFGRVDIRTGRPEGLVVDALHQALDVLEDTEAKRKQIVEWLARGEHREASETLVECFGAWSQVHQSIMQSLAFLGLDEQSFMVGEQALDDHVRGIPEQLLQIKEALQAGDNVLLADVLEYEFDETTNRWSEAVKAILEHAQAALDGAAITS